MTDENPPTPLQYFRAHAAEQQEYIPVFVARPVRAGENFNAHIEGMVIENLIAKVDGYTLKGFVNDPHSTIEEQADQVFMTPQDIFEKTYTLESAELPLPRADLEPDVVVEVVPRGTEISIGKPGQEVPFVTEYEGFRVTNARGSDFISRHVLTSMFNYAGKKIDGDEHIVALRSAAPLRGVIVPEDTVMNMEGYGYRISAGSLIAMSSPTRLVILTKAFAQVGLRVQPDTILPVPIKMTGGPAPQM